ncbi:chromo domain-containing protein [Favolaschia claudopus]|uniref:Chromo domain-containing protein n=1 Tax=Favolaschia claudopus TaxID=2862362 RepID=A0AAW0DJX4_9AGAR
MSEAEIIEISDRETPFSSREDDEETLWPTKGILKERKGQYLVEWAGEDEHGQPWKPSWVSKHDVTDDTVQEWKLKKAQAKKDKQRKASKGGKPRKSTLSASTSRQAPSVAPSSRSLRSTTVKPEDHESISRTPRKRQLSRTPVHVSDSESSPPPHKKRKLDHERNGARTNKTRSSTAKESRPAVLSDDEKEVAVFLDPPKQKHRLIQDRVTGSGGKGKERSIDPPRQRSDPPRKKRTPPQSHIPDQDDEQEDQLAPSSSPRKPIGVFSLDRHPVLSPRDQARLDQFDHDIAEPTQTPLFFPASSEEPEHPAGSEEPERSPSPSASPAQRGPSPVVSDYVPGPSLPPAPRSRRKADDDDSYRVGDVPETQSVADDRSMHTRTPSPPVPVVVPGSRQSYKSRMRPRSKSSMPPSPAMTGSAFKRAVREVAEEEGGEEDAPLSSIEQFSSPIKGADKKKEKGKGRAREGDWSDDEEEHQERWRRGEELAAAERNLRRQQMAEYMRQRPGKRTISQIIKQQQTQQQQQQPEQAHNADDSMVTESDVILPSTNGHFGHPRPHLLNGDVDELRQEEEENTQDVNAFYRRQAEEEEEHRGDAEPPSEDDGMRDGDVSMEDAAPSVGGGSSSEGRETEVDGEYDVDGPEKVAWRQESASQLNIVAGEGEPKSQLDTQNQDLDEDLENSELMYPPSDDEPPQNGLLEDGEIQRPKADYEEGEVHYSQDGASLEAQMHPSNEEQRAASERPSAAPIAKPPVITNGRSKSRSTSVPKKADRVEELPPTASTRHNTPESQPVPAVADPRQLDAAMSLLNVKSEENLRLERSLEEERNILVAARAQIVVLQSRLKAAEAQPNAPAIAAASSVGNDLAERLRAAEELLAAERKMRAGVEAERDAAQREKAAAEQQREVFQEYYMKASHFADENSATNKDLQRRLAIAEEQTKEGLALVKATFDAREETLKMEARDWRNQAIFLREQAIRTNDDELRRRAAEHPELLAKYKHLAGKEEYFNEQKETLEEEVRVKQDELDRLEQQLNESNEEIANLKAEQLVTGDTQVYRCGWRGGVHGACRAFFTIQQDLADHASMHVTRAVVDSSYGSQ